MIDELKDKEDNVFKEYIWVLDFSNGKVYLYVVPEDVNDIQSFLIGAGHSLGNIEWMNTDEDCVN